MYATVRREIWLVINSYELKLNQKVVRSQQICTFQSFRSITLIQDLDYVEDGTLYLGTIFFTLENIKSKSSFKISLSSGLK